MIDRYGIHVGELYFRFYGMIIMFGAVLAAILSHRRAKKAGQDPELIWDMLIWLLIAGVLGALSPSALIVRRCPEFDEARIEGFFVARHDRHR